MGKGAKTLIVILSIIIILLAAGLYFFFIDQTADNNPPSIDEVVERSVEIPEITTNLAGDEYIRISFMIQADSNAAKKELEKREFQLKNIIIKELSGMEAEEIEGTEGKIHLEDILKSRINAIMLEGQIEDVYIMSYIIQ